MISDNLRLIFTAEPRERIVSVFQHRDRVLIATEYRILEWNDEQEEFSVLEFVRIGPEPPGELEMVYAYNRARPNGF